MMMTTKLARNRLATTPLVGVMGVKSAKISSVPIASRTAPETATGPNRDRNLRSAPMAEGVGKFALLSLIATGLDENVCPAANPGPPSGGTGLGTRARPLASC